MTIDREDDDLAALRDYRLTEQIGHVLRRASQRHTSIFTAMMMSELTPTRFAALAMLFERGSLSQNELGRLTAMDIATIKGVVDRLSARGLVSIGPHPNDARRNMITLTAAGVNLLKQAIPLGRNITDETLKRLTNAERRKLVELLRKIT